MNRNILTSNLRNMTEAPTSVSDDALVRLYEALRDCGMATTECIENIKLSMLTIRVRHARPFIAA